MMSERSEVVSTLTLKITFLDKKKIKVLKWCMSTQFYSI